MFVLLSVLIFSLTRFGLSLSNSQNEIAKGQIIDKVVCAADATESYALYLPSNYTATKKWPILYAFDPGARGKIPVEHYREAAEKFGWIVIGSNNSQNGSWKSSLDAWNAITNDTHDRFSIDDRRLYATGFSGGARAAIMFAAQCNCVAGVIASGAGFPQGMEPAPTMHFVLVATTGTEDFNFPEVKALDDKLNRAGIAHQVQLFAGRHEWPPPPVAHEAMAWLELMAMKSGRREKDSSLIDEWWNAGMKEAREFEVKKDLYSAYQTYLNLSTPLKTLRDVSDAENKISELRNNNEVRDAIRDEQQQIRKQRDLEAQIGGLIASLSRMKSQGFEEGLGQMDTSDEPALNPETRLHQILTDLGRQAKLETDSGARRVARRVLDGEYIGLFERGFSLLQTEKRYDESARIFDLATQVQPERSGAFYYLAWAYNAKGDKKKSLAALQKAVDRGFSDLTALSQNKAFDSLRNDPQFQKIVGALKAAHDPGRPN